MYSQVNGMGLFGMNAFKVTAEIISSRGQPSFDIVGLGDLAVQESKMRIKGALSGIGIAISGQKLTVNLAPADVRKCGSLYDFTIIAAILYNNRRFIGLRLYRRGFARRLARFHGRNYQHGNRSQKMRYKTAVSPC